MPREIDKRRERRSWRSLFCWMCKESLYFTSSNVIGTDYQNFPILWYNYGTKTRLLLHFLTGNTFKELSADIATESTIHRSLSNIREMYPIYSVWRVRGRNDWWINDSHDGKIRMNFFIIRSVTTASISERSMAATKSAFFMLLFFPLSVSASSSVSVGIANRTDSRSYAGANCHRPPLGLYNEKFFRCMSELPVSQQNITTSQ